MPRTKKPAKPPSVDRATLAVLPAPALITENHWERGGVRILYANPAFCELTGYDETELAGKNTSILYGPKTEISLLQPSRHGGPSPHQGTGEGWLCRKDGRPFFAQWVFRPVAAAGDQMLAVYRDQSEAKRLREALLQSQKLDTVGLLASGMAHDFSNLLSVINGYCEIMHLKLGRMPAAQKDLQEIQRAGLKASAIARQILEFSRRQETEVLVVNFNTLIREIADILRRVAGEDVAVELRLASDLGNARIDPTHFQQVLLNLCFNARDAMPHGGKLTIRTYNHQVASAADRRTPEMPNGSYVVMQVVDTGRGISPGDLKNIFEPFFTTKTRGMGLGLPTLLGIIRRSDGHVAVQSTPGTGTKFEIYLPETAETEQTPVTPLGTLPGKRGTETVLVVEEDEVLRKMFAGILATDGYRVTECASPADAAAIVAQTALRPQLLIANGNTKSALALVGGLLSANPKLRLISTAPESPAAALPAFPSRQLVHLPKPFALSLLLTKVRALLDEAGR